jgi:Zn-dependent alcohol dehydrogenase
MDEQGGRNEFFFCRASWIEGYCCCKCPLCMIGYINYCHFIARQLRGHYSSFLFYQQQRTVHMAVIAFSDIAIVVEKIANSQGM